ncbi:MAG: hypothetical protein E7460_09780 [Ruminococcaceae bacterium]|nr:hypothetical protein [Oscillospiraceae bacterium]
MDIRSLCGMWQHRAEGAEVGTEVYVPGNRREYSGFESYAGASVFSKSFTLSADEAKKHIELRFAGVRKTAAVRLNGEDICAHFGPSPFRADLTGKARPGENHIQVTVSDEDFAGVPNAPLFDIIPLPVCGIFDSVSLELSAHAFVRDIYAPVDLSRGVADLRVTVFSREKTGAKLDLCFIQNGKTVAEHSFDLDLAPGTREHVLPVGLGGLKLWSPDEPVLCKIEATLTAGNTGDTSVHVTGLKALETRGTEFYLNGLPIYMLGYGDDFVWPEGAPCGKTPEFFAPGILRAKEYGFNYARHHSHFPFEAFLSAADGLGLMLQPELELANVPRETLNGENKHFFLDQWRELILAHRHHPCIATWCGGNEMEWGYPFDGELYAIAKELDPYRPAASTDGNFMACDVNDTMDFASICPAEYTDFLPWDELSDMFTRDSCGKPQIVHEMGNYTTLPDRGILVKYASAKVRPENILRLAGLVEEKDLAPLCDKALSASRSLQKLCHKLNVEKTRLSPNFAGYHLWTLTEFYGSTQGLLDPYFGDKAFTAEEFAHINSQTVVLWDTDRVTFASGEKVKLKFALSRYGADGAFEGRVKLALSSGETGEYTFSARGHGLFSLGEWVVTLPSADKAELLTLTAGFETGGKTFENSWELFVFPRVRLREDREIYLNYMSKHLFADGDVPTRHFTIPQPIGEGQLIVTEHMYGGMAEAVCSGANLLLLAGRDTFKNTVTRNSFKSPWWDNGEIWYLNHSNNSQVCGIVEPCVLSGAVPYSGGWKLDLFNAVEQAPSVDIDELGLKADAYIYGVDAKLSRRAYLFGFRMGKGKVLVCTFNHGRADYARPETNYYLKSAINFAMSDGFCPEASLTAAEFSAALK